MCARARVCVCLRGCVCVQHTVTHCNTTNERPYYYRPISMAQLGTQNIDDCLNARIPDKVGLHPQNRKGFPLKGKSKKGSRLAVGVEVKTVGN